MAFKKNRLIAVEERNNRIEDLGIAELKKYLCMKNGQDPKKCDGCPGIKGCRAGQRAIVLLNEQELEEKKRQIDIGANRFGSPETRSKNAREKFIQALNQPDMISFVMETYGNSRNCARENLKHWARKFPDVAEMYGFENKFDALSLCRKTVITGDALEKQRIAKEKYAEAASQPDPIAFCMEKYEWSRAKAVHNYGQWKRRYGEIKKEEETVVNDDISVEDFLNEVETITESTQKSDEEVAVPEKQDGEVETKNQFLDDLNAKFRELDKEKERLKDRLVWIEKAQDALAMTLNIFNPESAISKGLLGE